MGMSMFRSRENKKPSAFTLGSGFGGLGQNRTADTRIFRSCQTDENYRFSADSITKYAIKTELVSV